MLSRRLAFKCCGVVAAAFLLAMRVMAENAVPTDGMTAEMEKRWDDAVTIYKAVIEKDSTRGDLWLRIAQIEASLGHRSEAAEALRQARELNPKDVHLQFQLAEAYSMDGKPDQALETVDRALTLDPKNLEYLRARASYANWLGDAESAFLTYKRILAVVPDDETALMGLAGSASWKGKRNDYKDVAEALRKAAEKNPENAGLRFRTAQAYSLAGQPDSALTEINLALVLDPKNVEYLRARALYANWLGKTQVAMETYQRILAIAPNDESALAGLEGAPIPKGKRADYEAIAETLRKTATSRPKDAKLQFKIAQIYSLAGKPDSALEAVDRALALDPKNLEYLRARALYANWLGKTQVAMDTYQRILALAPSDENALIGLQGAVSAKGKKSDREIVAEAVRKTASLSPKNAGLQFRTAQAYSLADKPDKALEAVDRALALEPKNLEYLRARALYANWLDDMDIAGETYKRILAIVPNDENAAIGFVGAASHKGKHADREAATESLRKLAATKPNDANMQYQLAKAFSMANKPKQALEAIERAVAIDSKNADYLLARGQYASWLGKLDIAEDSYRRIVAISPKDDKAILNLARAQAWGGNLDESILSFKDYLKEHPEDSDAMMDCIKVETWRGGYDTAMKGLEDYKQRFGATMDYRKQMARVLASADRPAAAMDLITPLLQESPDDYEVLYSQAEALHYARQHREALSSLAMLESIRPESIETKEMRRFATANIRHYLSGGAEYYTESDSIRITRYHGEGGYQINPKIRLMVGIDKHVLRADTGSGLDGADGRTEVSYRNFWQGIDYLIAPKLNLAARAGGAKASTLADGSDDLLTYGLGANYRPADSMTLMLANGRDFFAVSPRAVSLGIYRKASSLRALWTPDLNYTVDAGGGYNTYSDGNTSWEAALAPRRSVIRNQRLNLDMGVYLWWLGFDDTLYNGYYSPTSYERYAVKADGYWKLNENNGIALVFTAGEQKDDTMSRFDFGTSGDIDGQFGIYRNWMLRLHFGYTHNVSSVVGNFDARIYGARLEKRF